MLLDEWERSGGSAAQFADYVGIRYSTCERAAEAFEAALSYWHDWSANLKVELPSRVPPA
jgi:hypothetical protein